jgi:hypothetical protein
MKKNNKLFKLVFIILLIAFIPFWGSCSCEDNSKSSEKTIGSQPAQTEKDKSPTIGKAAQSRPEEAMKTAAPFSPEVQEQEITIKNHPNPAPSEVSIQSGEESSMKNDFTPEPKSRVVETPSQSKEGSGTLPAHNRVNGQP